MRTSSTGVSCSELLFQGNLLESKHLLTASLQNLEMESLHLLESLNVPCMKTPYSLRHLNWHAKPVVTVPAQVVTGH